MNAETVSREHHESQIAALQRQIVHLNEQLEWFKRQVFGKKSEKIVTPTAEVLCLPGFELKHAAATEHQVKSHTRRVPKRNGQDAITLPDDLPVERQIIDLPEQQKSCPETGAPLVKIGEEVTQKIAHKPGSYFVKEIIRYKYALPLGDGILTPPLPESLLERCQADESFLADLITKKFCDHLPLYRQAEILSREGIGISRQILCKWVVRAGLALKPLVDRMTRLVLESGNVFVDESPVKMLQPGKGKTHQGFMWVLVGGKQANPSYRVYEFYTDRKHSRADELLKGYAQVLHSDKYGAYESLANRKQIIWCPCWTHIRRKFLEAETGDPHFQAWILRKIRYLFMYERVAWGRSEQERLDIRQTKEAPIIDELIQAVKKQLTEGKILPKSKMGEALRYFYGLIPYLKNYTKYPFARLDNNVAERAVRPLALGRKNWLFVGNEEGGEAAAILFSLVQTCRALGVNPREYLEDVMRRLMSHPVNALDELLPDKWEASRSQNLKPPSVQSS
jgi:transposase